MAAGTPPPPGPEGAPASVPEGLPEPQPGALDVAALEAALARWLERVIEGRRRPRATYRLQFNGEFTFADALAIVDYLDELGVSEGYPSPVLMSTPSSTHGYDICSHERINPELGGEDGFARWADALRARDMGVVLDIVPNHMGIADRSNQWWMDVLENGPSSRYAHFFDIDWHPLPQELEGRVLLPILEDQYGIVLEAGKLALSYEAGAFYLNYYETRLPIAPQTFSYVLGHMLEALRQVLGAEHEHVQELESILTALQYLPPRVPLPPDKLAERYREKEVIKRRIHALHQAASEVREALERGLEALNGRVEDPHSFDALDRLIMEQSYRPAYWRVALEEINYRRFFDINSLAAIRVELGEVFDATHCLVLRLVAEGRVTGLRIDHLDGLWNPPRYLRKLQVEAITEQLMPRDAAGGFVSEACAPPAPEESGAGARAQAQGAEEAAAPPAPTRADVAEAVGRWFDAFEAGRPGAREAGLPIYVVAEKILTGDEPLPEEWNIEGTTGYDFLHFLNGLFVDSAQRKAFDRVYSQFIERQFVMRDLANDSKKMILRISMASELNALSLQLDRIVKQKRRYRDFTLNSLTTALREIIAALPVYRTYVNHATTELSERDRHYLEAALAEARRRNPSMPATVFDFLEETLLLRNRGQFTPDEHAMVIDFIMKFQQITGPVMAKGLEDTSFYIYNRLASLNEVGGEPEHFGLSVEAFHEFNAARRRLWPHAMLATATHDTKRGEDVRARLNVLSEMPGEWRAAIARWSRRNAPHKSYLDGQPAPDLNDEYLLYQTLVGAWPESPPASGRGRRGVLPAAELATFRARVTEYMLKAAREANTHASWINPNEAYEQALARFVEALLTGGARNSFLQDLRKFAERVAAFGRVNALAQQALKLTSPGVPDLYQGSELWDLRLVDPDNRRPVDYALRRRLLDGLREAVAAAQGAEGGDLVALCQELLAAPADGRAKLYLLWRLLDWRREDPELFALGDYRPLDVAGEKSECVCAFARVREGRWLITVAPRLAVNLTTGRERWPLGGETWGDTRLLLPEDAPAGVWTQRLSGEAFEAEAWQTTRVLPLARLCAHFPVAVICAKAR